MIHNISSDLPTFKNLTFKSGLNILVAHKKVDSSDKQTRNGSGKSSLVEIVHLLMGSNLDSTSMFRSEALQNAYFSMEFDLNGEQVCIERSGKRKSKIHVSGSSQLADSPDISLKVWREHLGDQMFNLTTLGDVKGYTPTFRSLFPYYARRWQKGGFAKPEKHSQDQQTIDYQSGLMFLMDLDWRLASRWQQLRDSEKRLGELKKANKDGALGGIIGKSSELRTHLTLAEAKLQQAQQELGQFKILPQYRELEKQADELTAQISELSNKITIDKTVIQDLTRAMEAEAPPAVTELESIYEEAGIVLPNIATKRYEDVRRFHESVIQNRRDYLEGELRAAQRRISNADDKRTELGARRQEIMQVLESGGALDQYSKLQNEVSRTTAQVEMLRERFNAAEEIEGSHSRLSIERSELELRLRKDFKEQSNHLSKAILAFESTSSRLYENAGELSIESTPNGPAFKVTIQGDQSRGISNMQIFCFDMMLMRLSRERGIGPGFLIHDSHLFDGVDGRQIIQALKVGAEIANELGFQYIVTMNEDDVFKERVDGFDVTNYFLDVKLTDATDDGGLFGIRF